MEVDDVMMVSTSSPLSSSLTSARIKSARDAGEKALPNARTSDSSYMLYVYEFWTLEEEHPVSCRLLIAGRSLRFRESTAE